MARGARPARASPPRPGGVAEWEPALRARLPAAAAKTRSGRAPARRQAGVRGRGPRRREGARPPEPGPQLPPRRASLFLSSARLPEEELGGPGSRKSLVPRERGCQSRFLLGGAGGDRGDSSSVTERWAGSSALAAGEGHRGRGPGLPAWTLDVSSAQLLQTRKSCVARLPQTAGDRQPPCEKGPREALRTGRFTSAPHQNPALSAPGASSAPGSSELNRPPEKQGSSHQFPSSNPVRWCPVRSLMTKNYRPCCPSCHTVLSTYKACPPRRLEFQRPHAPRTAQRLP